MGRAIGMRRAATRHLIGAVGAATGAAATTALGFALVSGLLLTTPGYGAQGAGYALGGVGVVTLTAFFLAWVVFALGVAIFGAPLRWLLARLGQENRAAAAVAGAAASGAAATAVFLRGQLLDWAFVAVISLAGALAGLIYLRSLETRP